MDVQKSDMVRVQEVWQVDVSQAGLPGAVDGSKAIEAQEHGPVTGAKAANAQEPEAQGSGTAKSVKVIEPPPTHCRASDGFMQLLNQLRWQHERELAEAQSKQRQTRPEASGPELGGSPLRSGSSWSRFAAEDPRTRIAQELAESSRRKTEAFQEVKDAQRRTQAMKASQVATVEGANDEQRLSVIPNEPKRDSQISSGHESEDSSVFSCRRIISISSFVKSPLFGHITAVILLSNSVFIGFQVQSELQGGQPVGTFVVDLLFNAVFVVELVIRIIGFGCRLFWRDKENRWWNRFDFVIVTISVVDSFISLLFLDSDSNTQSDLENIAVLRILRSVRIIRAFRIIRVLRFFRDLRMLILSIVGTLKTASFAMSLILVVMYMFSIAITQQVAGFVNDVNAKPLPADGETEIALLFGSLPLTMFTLFMTITGGIDWRDASDVLKHVGLMAISLFVMYVVLMLLCVMNVLTGIFCQAAIETAQNDRDIVIQLQLERKNAYVHTLRDLLSAVDTNGDGTCTVEEFMFHIENEETTALLSSLEIEPRDAKLILEMMDENGAHTVDLDEFITRCLTLRGGAKAVQMEKVSSMNAYICSTLDSIEEKARQILKREQRLAASTRRSTIIE